jgi:glycosyltransferase involved in cell wall biosynthesis
MIAALDATPLTIPTGGIRRYTAELARSLARNFPEDEYWLLSDQGFDLPDDAPANLRRGDGPRNFFERRWWSWGLQREMMPRGVEVFHGTDFAIPYSARRATVMTVHDLSPWVFPEWQPDATRIRRRTGLLVSRATMIVTPSEAIRSAVIERFGIAEDRVRAIPLAAADHFRRVESGRGDFFLFAGTVEPRKNVGKLVEAWREVRKTYAVDLMLAGRVRSDSPVIAPEAGLKMMGAVAEEELRSLYCSALAVVYPSLYEGFGLPVLEAMQCGALVVTSRDPAIMEVSGDGAVHVDAKDGHALTEALLQIAADPEKFECIRARAMERAKLFSWDKTAQRTREVYVEAKRRFES